MNSNANAATEAIVAATLAVSTSPLASPKPVLACEPVHIESILVPTDFSPGAQRALHYAAAFASKIQARVTLLNVVEPMAAPDAEYFPLLLDPVRLLSLAEEQLAELPEDENLPARLFKSSIARTGIAFYEITETARSLDMDLIILARSGFSSLQHTWLGSTTARVVRHAHCPVLVVGEHARVSWHDVAAQQTADPLRISRILCAVDFSEFSEKALQYAGCLAKRFDASLDLLYVIEQGHKLKHHVLTESSQIAARQALHDRLASLAKKRVNDIVPVFPEVQSGDAVERIVTLARNRAADLVVVATHGRTGLRHVFLGSVAERVVHEAPCPVLVVREKNERASPALESE